MSNRITNEQNSFVMKAFVLISAVFICSLFIHSQTIQLPGIGSTNITVSSGLVNPNTELHFGNSEYSVIGFELSFPTNSNPAFMAVSTNNHFTNEMITEFANRVPGSNLNLKAILKSAPVESASWQKNYVVSIAD